VLLNPDWPDGLIRDPADLGAGPLWIFQKNGQCNDPIKPSRAGRSTRDPGENRPDLVFFFFQIWDLKPISIYTLCSQEKNYVFSMWDKKLFGLNTST